MDKTVCEPLAVKVTTGNRHAASLNHGRPTLPPSLRPVAILATGLVVAILAGVTAWSLSGSGLGSRDALSLTELIGVAAAVNRKLPTMVDEQTELTSVVALDRVLVYQYRLIDLVIGAVDRQALMSALIPATTARVCANPEVREGLLSRGVSMRFSYSDKNQAPIVSVDVSPAACERRRPNHELLPQDVGSWVSAVNGPSPTVL